jgi:uncharacterized protein (DUF58 family)
LRGYLPGDSPRRIAWKAFARTSELLVRDFRGGADDDVVWIDWDSVSMVDVEARVAHLTRMVLDAFEQGRHWGLRVPGSRVGPEQGIEHLHDCLRCLATAGLPRVQR